MDKHGVLIFFFFKQKTAYEIYQCDWSSDVCSSDLQSCGQTTSIDITSTGRPANDSSVSQTLVARYAQPTVAQYSYIVNDSVWAGGDRIINGPYHSNGGIRMDGTTNAPVTSSLSSWTCTPSFGCSTNTTEPGVFGSGSNQNLWKYPTPQMDFSAIAANFSNLKSIAQSQGLYFPRFSSGRSEEHTSELQSH